MADYDLIIIGGGSAAFAAATKASDLNIKTALINTGLPPGGTCVNVGCVPSKHLLEAGNTLYYAINTGFKAVKASGKIDFKEAIKEKAEVVRKLQQENYRNVLNKLKNVALYEGKAIFIDRNKVQVGNEILEGKKFVLATGSSPFIPPFQGIDKVSYWTNVEALSAKKLPKSLIIIGAGPLGLEFSQMYAHFGSKVTVLQRGSQILSRTEPEVADELKKNLTEEGINIVLEVDVKSLEEEGMKIVQADVAGKRKYFKAEQVLIATGRSPNTKGIGLEKAGVELDQRGFIKVNELVQTSNPDIYAAGDCATPMMLETLAAKMGATSVENAFANANKKINYYEIPATVFTNPQVASVGYSEEEYSKKTGRCACRTLTFDLVPKAQIVKDTRGVIKMTADPDNLTIVGVQICAPLAADMIHEATLAVKFKLKIDDIIDTTHVFPTLSEAIKKVAHAFKRDVSTMACCIE